jgi:hypothetical protein
MDKKGLDFNIDKDVREFPTYGIAETAHYLQIPQTTLRSWVVLILRTWVRDSLNLSSYCPTRIVPFSPS